MRMIRNAFQLLSSLFIGRNRVHHLKAEADLVRPRINRSQKSYARMLAQKKAVRLTYADFSGRIRAIDPTMTTISKFKKNYSAHPLLAEVEISLAAAVATAKAELDSGTSEPDDLFDADVDGSPPGDDEDSPMSPVRKKQKALSQWIRCVPTYLSFAAGPRCPCEHGSAAERVGRGRVGPGRRRRCWVPGGSRYLFVLCAAIAPASPCCRYPCCLFLQVVHVVWVRLYRSGAQDLGRGVCVCPT